MLLTFSLVWIPADRAATAQTAPVVTGNVRVDKLLSQMTLEEKMALIRGASEDAATYQGQAGYLTGIPRLGIPPLRLADGPPGVLTRLPSQAETATMGLAATFSRDDAEANGTVIGREAKSLGIDVVLEPFINIDRDITFYRGYNTYGEDPVLTGQIASALVRGIQGEGVMAQAKHYVAYDTNSLNVYVDQQALREIYVAPFYDVIKAGVSSIMCSYNKVNGEYACGNHDTLTGILRDEIGFKGFVTSDWGAIHAPSFIKRGVDMEMPGSVLKDSVFSSLIFSFFGTKEPDQPAPARTNTFEGFFSHMPEEPQPASFNLGGIGSIVTPRINFWNLIQSGELREDTITRAAGRVLYEYDKFGYLDRPPSHKTGEHAVEANAKIIEKTGEDAAVLLKNDGGILPLKLTDLGSLAMVGPGAGQVVAIGTAGERSIGWPSRQISPYQALKQLDPAAKVGFVVADDMTGVPIPAEVLSHDGKRGVLCTKNNSNRVESTIDFTKSSGRELMANSEMTCKATLTVRSAGSYWIYLQLLGAAGNVTVDGKRVAEIDGSHGDMHGNTTLAGKDGLVPTTDGLDNLRTAVDLTAGSHSIQIHISGDISGSPEQARLAWYTPERRAADHAAAIAAAKDAKTAVVFVWSRGNPNFALPGEQDKLVEEVARVNPNTIVVLNISQPIALPWLDKVKAVLLMWWPGDEGGWSTAKLLLGRSGPAGRLPFTWAKHLEDYAANDPRYPERSSEGVDGKTIFSEGVNVGYRWFDKERIDPLFPFGFGLSYTTFEYSGLKVENASDGGLNVNIQIKNTGGIDSDEVPQVYLGMPDIIPADVHFPVRALATFARIHLAAGETEPASLHIPLRQLQYWSARDSKWEIPTGPRMVFVGRSSRDLPLETKVE
jgi:beta-glucosidase